MRQVIVLAGALALAGCQTASTSDQIAEAAKHVPPNYRHLVADHIRKTFKDPYTIRDASISGPVPGTSFSGSIASICVRANAKNSMGAYIGIKATQFVFRNGVLDIATEIQTDYACAGASYEPFPEIEEKKPRA